MLIVNFVVFSVFLNLSLCFGLEFVMILLLLDFDELLFEFFEVNDFIVVAIFGFIRIERPFFFLNTFIGEFAGL